MSPNSGRGDKPPDPPAADGTLPDAPTLPAEPTVEGSLSATQPHWHPTDDQARAALEDTSFEARYAREEELGRGGMGVVHLLSDARIGRHVAMKAVRKSAGPDGATRFLREARVQGQLEHPAIVPVYDLGVAPDGSPYFTMKRLKGMTLREILEGHRNQAPEIMVQCSRRRLLTEFVNVCQAIEFAHTRGVLHRDLKPNNVMLGCFGEVYVLDWGVAKIAGVPDEVLEEPDDEVSDTEDGSSDATARGAVLGTPGYIAPEQLRGDIDEIDARSEVYALGAMLFEILTLQPLHVRDRSRSMLESTLKGADARASVRAPEQEVPPELEDICVKATALAREDRYQSVAELLDDLQRYLDGDRDLERRQRLAEEYAEIAAAEAERALGDPSGPESTRARSRAMREASRALALDPTHEGAVDILSRLMLEPPAETPPEVEATLTDDLWETMRRNARTAAVAYLACMLFAPLHMWMGVRNQPLFLGLGAFIIGLSLAAFWLSRRTTFSWPATYFVIALNAVFLAFASRIFGPFVLIPGLAALSTAAFVLTPTLPRAWIAVVLGCLAIVGPLLLEWVGVLAPSYSFEDGAMVVHGGMQSMAQTPATIFLLLGTTSLVIAAGAMMVRFREASLHTTRRLHMHSWHLRQLIPERARRAVSSTEV
jgi:serine/threonine-protein kinase